MQVTQRYIILGGPGRLEDLQEQLMSRGVCITHALPLVGGFLCDLPELRTLNLQTLENVRWIEKDSLIRVVAGPPYLYRGVIFDSIPWGVRRVGAPKVWKQTRGKGVRVGVIDTGIDLNHPDLLPNLAEGPNVLNPEQSPSDDNGHGTHVAGTIAAAKTGRGVIGVAPEATVVPIKAFDHNGEARLSAIILGIEWAVKNQIQILNMSFGTSQSSLAMRRAVNAAHRAGLVMVAATGNGKEKLKADYPARFRSVLGVGAVNILNEVVESSTGGYGLDLVAPGKDILSTWTGGLLETLSGTSMAAAHISGVAALILASNRELRPNEVYDLIIEAAEPLTGVATSRQGAGLLDVSRILS